MKSFSQDLMGANIVHCLYNTHLQINEPKFGLIQLVSRGTPRRVSTYVNDIERFAKEFEELTGYKVFWECGPALYFYYLTFEKGRLDDYRIISSNNGSLKISSDSF